MNNGDAVASLLAFDTANSGFTQKREAIIYI